VYIVAVAKLQLEKVLEKKGMSKRQFAKLLGVDPANVFRFFRAGYNPTFQMLVKWAEVLKIKVRDLIEE
jgi:transcriptional regulator with XRE-family HTH domain